MGEFKENPALYAVAKRITLEAGFDYTDPRTITTYKPTVVDYLAGVASRDKEKGGDGMRSTRDVAERLGMKMATARRQLWAAVESGEIECFDGGASGAMGNEIFWCIKSKPEMG